MKSHNPWAEHLTFWFGIAGRQSCIFPLSSPAQRKTKAIPFKSASLPKDLLVLYKKTHSRIPDIIQTISLIDLFYDVQQHKDWLCCPALPMSFGRDSLSCFFIWFKRFSNVHCVGSTTHSLHVSYPVLIPSSNQAHSWFIWYCVNVQMVTGWRRHVKFHTVIRVTETLVIFIFCRQSPAGSTFWTFSWEFPASDQYNCCPAGDRAQRSESFICVTASSAITEPPSSEMRDWS